MANGRKKPQNFRKRAVRRGRRSGAPAVQAQGTGTTVAVPFGSIPRSLRSPMLPMHGWNAFHPCHLPLPRAVGPYTVIRTSRLITTSDKYIQFGSFVNGDGLWLDTVALSSVDETAAVNATTNTRRWVLPTPAVAAVDGSGFTCVPSAISVQVMNNNALMEASGIFAGTVCHTQLSIGGRTETYNDLSTGIISYMRPRLMSGGKLALKGVQADSYPLNMSLLANFEPINTSSDGSFTYSGSGPYAAGFAPIVFVNQNKQEISYLVCVEWRVRFDIGSAAVASHVHHGVTPDSTWNKCIEKAVSLGNGMKEIADVVATVGQSISNVRAAYARSGAMPMLVD